MRLFVRGASGRRRYNVLGAGNAVARRLIRVFHDTRVSSDTMTELLRTVAAQTLVGPVTVVRDNARYRRNTVVQGLAVESGIRSLFLPSYSPNRNRIERLWGFAKRTALRGKHYPDFTSAREAIDDCLDRFGTDHQDALATLMTLNFQTFDNASVLAA